jgi:hypothetical protein
MLKNLIEIVKDVCIAILIYTAIIFVVGVLLRELGIMLGGLAP